MALISVGIDHEHASLDLLERATVAEHEWRKVLRTLISHRNIHEAVFVSTCLRTEVVAVIDRFHGAIDEITATLAEATGLAPEEFQDLLTVHFDRGVANHLFAVAAGLKSVVPGEFEILGQLRRALELANEEQTAGAELDGLFHRALASGRHIRHATAISRGTTSFAQAAVDLATSEMGEELRDAEVIVIGAGQLASGVVKSLLAAPERLGRLTVVNRGAARAEALAGDVDDQRLVLGRLTDLDESLTRARLVVVAVDVATPIITREQLERCTQRLLVVDLGVPRAVAANVEDLLSVHRVDIGDLRERVAHALEDRRDALDEAHQLVLADVERFLVDQRARGAAAIVRELRDRLDALSEAELVRREHDLDELSADQRATVRSIVGSVVAKIAHRPTVALKEAAGTDQGARLSETTRHLFDL